MAAEIGVGQIGVGLIGAGYMGKCHALAWNAVKPTFGGLPAPRRVVLCAAEESEASSAAEAFGFARWTCDWREVVADPAVAVVSIAAPNHLHSAPAIAALEAGKHVWCEKPMAPSLAEAEAMAAAAEAAPGRTLLGYNYVQNPALGHARRLLAEGAIGRVFHARFSMDEDFMADPAEPWGLKSDRRSGYGVLDDFGCHLASLAHFLLGEIAAVSALAARPYESRSLTEAAEGPEDGTERRAVETDDLAGALLRFRSGASGLFAMSRAAWGRKGSLRIELHGDRGMIAFDQERLNELELYRADEDAATSGFRRILTSPAHPPYGAFIPAPGHNLGFNDLKVIEARHLLRVIAGEEEPIYDFRRGLALERVVHALARSAESGEWVETGV